jgi:type IV secretory pathway VirB10-like protein
MFMQSSFQENTPLGSSHKKLYGSTIDIRADCDEILTSPRTPSPAPPPQTKVEAAPHVESVPRGTYVCNVAVGDEAEDKQEEEEEHVDGVEEDATDDRDGKEELEEHHEFSEENLRALFKGSRILFSAATLKWEPRKEEPTAPAATIAASPPAAAPEAAAAAPAATQSSAPVEIQDHEQPEERDLHTKKNKHTYKKLVVGKHTEETIMKNEIIYFFAETI